jgi:hypothetical protein
MSKKNTANTDPELDKHLENSIKDDEPLTIDTPSKQPDENDDLESYLKKNSSGSRAYGIKGQGW